MINRKKTLHKTGSSAVTDIAFEREGKKKKKEKKKGSYYNTGYSYLVTQPSRNLLEQGLALLSGRDAALSLWYHDSTLDNFIIIIIIVIVIVVIIIIIIIIIIIVFKISQKITKKEKNH